MVKKLIAVFLAVAMVFPMAVSVLAAESEKNYIIDNPYEDVDWDAWDDYKTQLH